MALRVSFCELYPQKKQGLERLMKARAKRDQRRRRGRLPLGKLDLLPVARKSELYPQKK